MRNQSFNITSVLPPLHTLLSSYLLFLNPASTNRPAAHCLDILRQQLMCTVDIGVLGKVWWNQDNPTPYPDFNTQHKCRDFEAVRNWAEKNQGPQIWPEDYLARPNMEDVNESLP
jgi:hypothetical protein